jgi:hypothetical protein
MLPQNPQTNDSQDIINKMPGVLALVLFFFAITDYQCALASSVTTDSMTKVTALPVQVTSRHDTSVKKAPAANPQDRLSMTQLGAKKMTQIESQSQLPKDYDSRLTTVLSQPVPEDVIISFYYMAAAKSPHANYRWELHRNGRLFLVHHSGKNISFEVTFDQPLPSKPTKVLTNPEIQALYTQLEQANFFTQPGFQRINVKGGTYVIVRARRGEEFHEVVYENIEGPLVQYLYSIAS